MHQANIQTTFPDHSQLAGGVAVCQLQLSQGCLCSYCHEKPVHPLERQTRGQPKSDRLPCRPGLTRYVPSGPGHGQHGQGVLMEGDAGRSWEGALGQTLKQGCTALVLQKADLTRQGRLGDEQLFSRPRSD